MECKNNKPYAITHISEIDVDDLASIPDSFLAVREVTDETTGATIYTPVRVPGQRVMPSGNLANVVALDKNNTELTLEFGDIYGGYIDTQPTGNVMRYADATHPAQFIMLGDYTNGKMLIQTSSFLYLPKGHVFIVGEQYYLDADGAPTTDSSATGQKLFLPLSETVLSVNGDF